MAIGADPVVARLKFDRELADYRAMESEYRRRGWLLVRADFPKVLIAFLTTRSRPQTVPFGALIDFTDYDAAPLSVLLVDPTDERPLAIEEILSSAPMLRRTSKDRPPQLNLQLDGSPGPIGVDRILQGFPGEPPFICLPGFREYHENPAHSGDSWLLHRGRGAGSLFYVLDQIWRYGTKPLDGMSIKIGIEPRVTYVED